MAVYSNRKDLAYLKARLPRAVIMSERDGICYRYTIDFSQIRRDKISYYMLMEIINNRFSERLIELFRNSDNYFTVYIADEHD